MLQDSLFARFKCLRCRTPARLHKFYRLCFNCCTACKADPKLAKIWLYTQHDKPKPTTHAPGSPEKIALMRKRLIRGQELFSNADTNQIDWSKINITELHSEPIEREAGRTGVERDGTRWRARPMADGVKCNLGEFKTEAEAIAAVEKFWRERLGLTNESTQDEITAARASDAAAARAKARQKREEARRQKALTEPTPLFG